MTAKKMPKLGDKVRDPVTGFVGIVTSETNYLHGCRRLAVQPELDKDGKIPDAMGFDEMQLEIMAPKAVPASTATQRETGGPGDKSERSMINRRKA